MTEELPTIDEVLQTLCNTVYAHGVSAGSYGRFHQGEPMKEAKAHLEKLMAAERLDERNRIIELIESHKEQRYFTQKWLVEAIINEINEPIIGAKTTSELEQSMKGESDASTKS